ncbi:MAG: START domain-containing protein [Gammaproteobacteria bacterium]|nr:START domain-containing protein [Gammaproteobacteria bacterium]MCW8958703.1 START domain-containing protein [Gammaproteobacteria bacterium]MCW8974012.1 START domain-containing protein [Gammaproteobacteria bacterium]MCW8994086.1 START domain-containing protein [Gammaproteobacteria bacterium]
MPYRIVPAAEIDPSWQRVVEREGVTVYRRAVPGSPIDESLAVTTLKTTLVAATALILDVDNHHRWIDAVDESRVLKRLSQTESINYTVSYAPWPVSDRDAVVRTRVAQDAASLIVQIGSEALPDYLPRKPGRVRVEAIASGWQLRPLPDGGVEVRYRVHSSPGGQLPGWLVNAVVTEQPLNTLINMQQAVQQAIYRQAQPGSIRQP